MLGQKFSTQQANTILQLLFGFDEEETSRPALYELLIALLESQQIAARELAHWHLVRLAPGGRDIPFDAAGPAPRRIAAVARWRQLIPAGELPPRPKNDKN